MPPADVSLCLITKDEPLLQGALESIRPFVKEIIVVVTGGSLTAAERNLIDVIHEYDGRNTELDCFDFSLARNRAFDLATRAYLMWMDADDVIEGGPNLKEELEFLESREPDAQLMMPYEYAYDRPYGQGGNVTCLLSRERIMKRAHGWRWDEPIHEAITPIPLEAHRYGRTGLIWKHRKTLDAVVRAHARNIEILRKVNAKRPTSRNVYYLAAAYFDGGALEEAKQLYVKFTSMTQYEDELHRVYLNLNDIALRQGQYDDAIHWGHKAIECKEKWFESYFALCRSYYLRADVGKNSRDWERAVHFGEMARGFPPAKSFQPVQPMVRAHDFYVWMTRAYDQLGRIEDAYEAAVEGLKAVPSDDGLKFNALLLGSALARAKLMSALRTLKEAAGKERAVDALIKAALGEATTFVQDTPFLPPEAPATAAVRVEQAALEAVPEKLDIVFACYGDTPWNPEILRGKGVGGGSEVAVVEMATRLAARGHTVTVYAPGTTSAFEGVTYLPQELLPGRIAPCDVLFAWRSTHSLPLVKAHLKLLWLHDVYAWNSTWSGPATAAEYAQADYLLCVSKWQARNLAATGVVGHEKMIVTRNGVARPERFAFDMGIKRQSGKVIWNSSPDRGLDRLLEMWPRLRGVAPHAELHIFYGFDGWMKYGQNKAKGEKLLSQIQGMKDEGVFYRGRVTQDELAAEMVGADCWFYPNWDFPEVSCVAAMEAQIAGLYIVTSNFAALEETTRGVSGSSTTSPENFETYAADALMHAPCVAANDMWRVKAAAEARTRFSLDTLADDWLVLLKEKLALKVKPFELPLYEGVLP